MSALADHKERLDNPASEPSITRISTNARIDYILRFSKQAILVVDQDLDVISQVAGEYLGTLPDTKNSAYITISPQHNNIQIRCRIIEQLFGNMLFDPEKSLAVTILNLAKEKNQAISIVVEQAHFLSLQILHELCQLSELAKKTQADIDVLMVGLLAAGSTISENKALFSGKISILSGESGQLLSFSSSLFKNDQAWYRLSTPAIWLISVLILITIAFATIVELHKRGLFSFSELIKSATPEVSIENTLNENESSFVAITKANETKAHVIESETQLIASNSEVFAALYQPPVTKAQSLSNSENNPTVNTIAKKTVVSKPVSHKPVAHTIRERQAVPLSELPILENTIPAINKPITASVWSPLGNDERISAQYYLEKPKGFVIQYSGFTEYPVFEEFKQYYKLNDFHGYLRSLNKKSFLVVTSKVYQTRENAEQALKSLPAGLINSGVWIKSLTAIKAEISAYTTAIN